MCLDVAFICLECSFIECGMFFFPIFPCLTLWGSTLGISGWGWLSTISEYWSVSDSSTEYPQQTIAITGQSLTISTIPAVIRKVVDGVFSGRQTDDSQLYHAVSVTGYNSHGNIHVFGLLSHTSKTRGWTSTHPVPSSLRFIDHRQLTDQSSSIQS